MLLVLPSGGWLQAWFPAVAVSALHCGLAVAAELEYRNSWVGNSFGGRDNRFVQHAAQTLFVAPDGTCFMNTPWEEGGNQVGVYRDGEHLGAAGTTHGWGANGGFAVTANARYVYIAHTMGNEGGHLHQLCQDSFPPPGKTWFGISRRTRESNGQVAASFEHGHGQHGAVLKKAFLVINEVPSTPPIGDMFGPAQVQGLALDGQGHLFVSNPYNAELRRGLDAGPAQPGRDASSFGEIMVYDGQTMRLIRSWACPGSRQVAVAPDDTLWVIQEEPGRTPARVVRHFTTAGTALPQVIADLAVPTALAIDRQGRVLVADDGPDQQVHVYTIAGDAVRRVASLGQKGGVWSGRRGRAGPQRFNGLVGVGSDAVDNLYVACAGKGGSAVTLESYRPDGGRNWALYGLLFVDRGAPDPATDGTDFFTAHERYRLDYSQPPGREWTYDGFTHDPWRSAGPPAESVWVRRIAGRRFLFSVAMGPEFLLGHRLDAAAEVAVPSVRFCPGTERDDQAAAPAGKPPGCWLWCDRNGNGHYDVDEYAGDGQRGHSTWAWWVDSRGHVWQGCQDASAVFEYPCHGLDPVGNPVYSLETAVSHELPPPFDPTQSGRRIERLLYVPEADAMLLSGYTDAFPASSDWKSIGPVLCYYDQWHGRKSWRWSLQFPMEQVANQDRYRPPHRYPMSFEVAGDYLFLVQCTPAYVHVFRLDTGAWCGMMRPGVEVGEVSGWVDLPYGLSALRRADGEYVVWVEEDYRGKNMMYRWRPRTARPGAAPERVAVTSGIGKTLLRWAPVPDATGYVVRRAAQAEGPFEIVRTGFRATTCADDGIANDEESWYTVEAANEAGSGPRSPAVQRRAFGARPPDLAPALVAGLAYEYHEGIWEVLPDFAAAPKSAGAIPGIGLPPEHRPDGFAVRLHGFLVLGSSGTYTFHLASDDGSRLWLGDDLLLDNDGLHGTRERSRSVLLQAGPHALRVEFFERDGGESLSLLWSGPGFDRQPVPPTALWQPAVTPDAASATPK